MEAFRNNGDGKVLNAAIRRDKSLLGLKCVDLGQG